MQNVPTRICSLSNAPRVDNWQLQNRTSTIVLIIREMAGWTFVWNNHGPDRTLMACVVAQCASQQLPIGMGKNGETRLALVHSTGVLLSA